jgi:hypothetical protein
MLNEVVIIYGECERTRLEVTSYVWHSPEGSKENQEWLKLVEI